MRIILVLLLISGCKTAGPDVSEPEFMTFAQDDPHLWDILERHGLNERILVKRVHDKSWDIDYAFAKCSKRKQKKYRPIVEEAIRRAVNLWLHPIRVMQKAITDGKFTSDPIVDPTKQPPALVKQLNIRERKKVFLMENPIQEGYATYDTQSLVGVNDQQYAKLVLKLPQMSVVFNCNEGRAFMYPYTNSINIYEEKRESTTTIPESKFSFLALLHETGHTFGLADTYTDPDNKGRDHMVSTGVHERTVGHQPISIMSITYAVEFTSYDDIKLTIDDRNGIFWLYAHMHMNKLKLDACPPHYQEELFERDGKSNPTIACRPKHPLLFAMTTKNYSTVRAIINNEQTSIDINARTHQQGFTALHYAVAFAPIGLLKTMLDNFHQQIDFNLVGSDVKNVPPLTALQVAESLLKGAQQKNIPEAVDRYSTIVNLLMEYIEG